MNRNPFFLVAFCLLLTSISEPLTAVELPLKSVKLPDIKPVELEPVATIRNPAIGESSGIIKSRRHEGIFWTLNDSGNDPRIFSLRLDGTSNDPSRPDLEYLGVLVLDAGNVDWEDIGMDDQDNLIIGAFGNNRNARRDLSLYLVPEPTPFLGPDKTLTLRKIPFHFPDQEAFPPSNRNFDCEAVFFAHGGIYLLTKHRSDTFTKLYRLNEHDSPGSNPLTLLDRFDIGGMVTGADVDDSGRRLAVIAYRRHPITQRQIALVWVFEQDDGSDRYFDGSISTFSFYGKQAEAICWDGNDRLVITNAQRDIFVVPVSRLHSVP